MSTLPGTASIAQSPVNISTTDTPTESFGAVVNSNYQSAHIEIINNGENIDGEFTTTQNSVTYQGEVYDLKGFHFHTDSEHTFNGQDADGEIHLVHRSSSGKFLVVGLLIEGVAANDPNIDPQLSSFFQTLENQSQNLQQTDATVSGGNIDPSLFISSSSQVYNYGGSLTTPAFGAATWVVAANTLKVDAQDLLDFQTIRGALFGEPLNSREIQSELFLGTSGQDFLEGDRNILGTEDLIYAKDGKDTLDGGQKDDKLFGEAGKDLLLGGDGNDYLDGGDGKDILNGNSGNDALTGGTGKDTFIFEAGFGTDAITDFKDGADVIDLRAFGDSTVFGTLSITPNPASETNVLITSTLPGFGSITLQNFTGTLDRSDFLFA